jgi:hypothetical protein
MLPNLLGTQNDQTVQTLPCVFWQTFNGLAPLVGEIVNRWLGRQGTKAKLVKNDCLDLSRKNTCHQNVLDGILSLVTERADSWVRQTTFCEAVCSPTEIFYSKPNEELALQGSPTLPNPSPGRKSYCTKEEGPNE